jgi:putative membrane protein
MLIERRLPLSYVFQKIGVDMAFVIGVGVAIEVIYFYFQEMLPKIPSAVAAFLGTAISLILGFKLAQSYGRWWEARKIWGAVVNDSRSITRQALTFAGEEGREIAERIAHRQIAWCYVLGQSLRGRDWQEGSEGHLTDEDRAEATAHANRPLVLLQQHGRDVRTLKDEGIISDFQRIAMDELLTRLTDSMGKAERIKNTVFPTAYRAYLHLFIYIFIVALALSLAELHGPREVVVITVISLPFFLLEKTATFLQDPFSGLPTDTPVTAIARVIEINLLQLLGEKDVPKPLEPNGFYLD